MKKAIYKVPNGKLLKIFVEAEGEVIGEIKITGDFFLYPEERVSELEKSLIGTSLEAAVLKNSITSFFAKTDTTTFGVDPESIALCIMKTQETTT